MNQGLYRDCYGNPFLQFLQASYKQYGRAVSSTALKSLKPLHTLPGEKGAVGQRIGTGFADLWMQVVVSLHKGTSL